MTLFNQHSVATEHHQSHPKYRSDIDGIRAIAVLAVIGFHAFPNLIRGGFVGVDIFFVISGFLISSIIFSNLETSNFSYTVFYTRRIKRIFPALILVLVSCFIFGWFFLLADEYKSLGKHLAASAGFISNFAFWQEAGYFDKVADTKPLLHLWSLGIEEQFYIVWPLLLVFLWKQKHNFLTAILFVTIASFILNIYAVKSHPIATFYSPLTRFWELMIGGILAYITLHKPRLIFHRSNLQSIIGMFLLVLSILLINKDKAFPYWWALLPTAGTFLLISAGSTAWLNQKNIR